MKAESRQIPQKIAARLKFAYCVECYVSSSQYCSLDFTLKKSLEMIPKVVPYQLFPLILQFRSVLLTLFQHASVKYFCLLQKCKTYIVDQYIGNSFYNAC